MVELMIVAVFATASVGFACSGSGTIGITSNRMTATATTSGQLHSGTYQNQLEIKESAVVYQTTNPGAGTTTTNERTKLGVNKASITLTHTVSGSTAMRSAQNKWKVTCRVNWTTKSGTATAR